MATVWFTRVGGGTRRVRDRGQRFRALHAGHLDGVVRGCVAMGRAVPTVHRAAVGVGAVMTPYYDQDGIQIFHGDCRDVLPTFAPESVDVLITDPPYGIRKAAWDEEYPTWYLPLAAPCVRRAMAITPGINNLLQLPRNVGNFEYRWMLSVHVTNGHAIGMMGFTKWMPVVVYGRIGTTLYRYQHDITAVPIDGTMPDHPTPKPLRAMTWIASRFEPGSILDCFMGSGTTLVAAKQLGQRAIGIEIEEKYCEIAARRLQQSVLDFAAVAP